MSDFIREEVVTLNDFKKITHHRVYSPGFAEEVAKNRKRRKTFTLDGNLNIVAVDHPARGSLAVGEKNLAMGNRHDLLARLVSVLKCDVMDGVLASTDILEELLILHGEMHKKGKGFLDEKLLITSLNRGGLLGSVWELNDPITAGNVRTCVKLGIDASKMLLRVDMSSADTLNTILACAEGVRDMNKENMPIFLEPLPVEYINNQYKIVKQADSLIPLITMTAALGNYSRNIWLKIPYTEEFNRVVDSTTLPIVILGGERNSLENTLQSIKSAMKTGHQVRGAMLGRNVLYPENSTPAAVAEAVGLIVHEGSR
ncbi:MAG: hypothetical protein WEA58_01385 [Balneolaceae bacterium]